MAPAEERSPSRSRSRSPAASPTTSSAPAIRCASEIAARDCSRVATLRPSVARAVRYRATVSALAGRLWRAEASHHATNPVHALRYASRVRGDLAPAAKSCAARTRSTGARLVFGWVVVSAFFMNAPVAGVNARKLTHSSLGK